MGIATVPIYASLFFEVLSADAISLLLLARKTRLVDRLALTAEKKRNTWETTVH